jgi:hypothetical protein
MDEEKEQDPDPNLRENSDPDQHYSEKLEQDQDPH